MKRLLKSVIVLVLALTFVFATGCGEGSWDKDSVTLKDGGKVLSANGFVAETENYVYFINGKGDSGENNEFGVPVKGSLMAMKKSDLDKDADKIEQCIVVPKLFVASDYTSGLFFYDGYVYYGTPTTDKDSSGTAASTVLEFMRTKLDGSGDTDKFFKTDSISDVYRFVEKEGTVYVVVHDSTKKEIISYNTKTKAETVIAKEDVKTEANETLNVVSFANVENAGDVAVVYTTKVFSAPYSEEEAQFSQYTRPTERYNKVYAYKVGEATAKEVMNGKDTGSQYVVNMVKDGYVYYTENKAVSINTASTYAIKLADLYAGGTATKLTQAEYASDANLIVSLDEVYIAGEGSGQIKKSTLVGDITSAEKIVVKVNTVTTLLFKDGDYIYYVNSSNYLARIKVDNVDEENPADLAEQVVSDSTVATDWFKIEKINNYVFYSDNSEAGCTYVKFVDVSGEPVESTHDDGHDHEQTEKVYEFKGQKQIGKVAEADMLVYTNAKLTAITESLESGVLKLDTYKEDGETKFVLVDGVPVNKAVEEVRALYGKLTDAQKKEFDAANLEILEKYEMAIKVSKAFYKLYDFDMLTTEQKTAKRADFESAKAVVEELKASDFDYSAIRKLVDNNLNWYYQIASEFFA